MNSFTLLVVFSSVNNKNQTIKYKKAIETKKKQSGKTNIFFVRSERPIYFYCSTSRLNSLLFFYFLSRKRLSFHPFTLSVKERYYRDFGFSRSLSNEMSVSEAAPPPSSLLASLRERFQSYRSVALNAIITSRGAPGKSSPVD